MLMKKDIDNQFIEACTNHGYGTENGNYKKANKSATKIFDVVTNLKTRTIFNI